MSREFKEIKNLLTAYSCEMSNEEFEGYNWGKWKK